MNTDYKKISLGLAKEIDAEHKRLGIVVESEWWWCRHILYGGMGTVPPKEKWYLMNRKDGLDQLSAYDISEGFNILPMQIKGYFLIMEVAMDKQYSFNYVTKDFEILNRRFLRHNPAEAVWDLYLWLLQNGHINKRGQK